MKRFGIIGCGLVSDFHGKAIQMSDKAELVGAADIKLERAQSFVEKYGGKAMSIDELISRDDIDVINVLTPNAYHEEYVVKAVRAGKHVLVEKPPEMTLEKTDNMIAEAEKAEVKLGVVLQCRFRKAIEAIKDAIDSGRFGRIIHADAYMKWYRPTEYYFRDSWRSSRSQGAGVIIQHAFHYIDLLHHLAGPVDKVFARIQNLAHPEVELEDTVIAILDYANGAQGLVQGSTALYPGTDIRIEINGQNGTAIMMGEKIITWKFKDERPEDESIRKIGVDAAMTAATGAADFGYYEHQWLIEDMVDAIENDRDPRITCVSARDTLATALAMYESGDTGKEAKVKR